MKFVDSNLDKVFNINLSNIDEGFKVISDNPEFTLNIVENDRYIQVVDDGPNNIIMLYFDSNKLYELYLSRKDEINIKSVMRQFYSDKNILDNFEWKSESSYAKFLPLIAIAIIVLAIYLKVS